MEHIAQRWAGWGPWTFNPTNLTLTSGPDQDFYYVDLEECTTAAQVLDWVVQIAGKPWATPEVVGYLVAALTDLLDPQATLCPNGQAKTVPRWVLNR